MLNHLGTLETVFLYSILKLSFHGIDLVFYIDLEPVGFLSDRVVHFETSFGDDLVTDLPYCLVSSFLHYKDQLLIKTLFHLLQTCLQFRCTDLIKPLILFLHIEFFNHLLKADKHIFITVDLFLKLLLAGLRLFDLQVERLNVALNLLDALDYFFFKYSLPALYGTVVTTNDASGFRMKLRGLALVLILSKSTSDLAFIHHGAAGGPQVIQLKVFRVTRDVFLDIIVLLQARRNIFQGIVHESTEAVKTGVSAGITLCLLFGYPGLYNC